jgi:hypothetical protein
MSHVKHLFYGLRGQTCVKKRKFINTKLSIDLWLMVDLLHFSSFFSRLVLRCLRMKKKTMKNPKKIVGRENHFTIVKEEKLIINQYLI